MSSRTRGGQERGRGRFAYLNKVTVDLIAVKVGVVRIAVSVVHAHRLLLDVCEDPGLVSHDTGLVQGGLAVDQEHIAINEVTIHLDARVGQEQLGLGSSLGLVEPGQVDGATLCSLDQVRACSEQRREGRE